MRKKNRLSRWIGILLCAALLICVVGVAVELIRELNAGNVTREISREDAQEIIMQTLNGLPAATASGAKYVAERTSVTVRELEYGHERDVRLNCEYTTLNVSSVLDDEAIRTLMRDVYRFYTETESPSSVNATRLQIQFEDRITELFSSAEEIRGETELILYEQQDGTFALYLPDETVDLCFGGLLSAQKAIRGSNQVFLDEETVDITNLNTLRTGVLNIVAFTNYSSSQPQTGGKLLTVWENFRKEFVRNFIDKDMWLYLVNGLLMTLEITGCAILVGLLIGFLIAVVRVSHDKNGVLPILNGIAKAYLSIIRGTPVMVQLLIIYFVFLAPIKVPKFLAAVLCFGLNSGAYVSEIVRGGIMSVDAGQIEAGRSLGLSYPATMLSIVIPQAFKAVLPALANEFIALLKETSVAFYIGVADLTQAGLRIRSITYSNFMPLIAVAVIYWVIVVILTKLVSLLERRLRQSER